MLIKDILRRLIHFYETKIAPSNLGRLYWPLYKFCYVKKICFITNIASGVGHTTAELDFFIRQKYLKEIDPDKHYILIKKPDQYSSVIFHLYKNFFSRVYIGYFWYFFFLPLIVRYKNVTKDCGLSRLKWHLGCRKLKVKYPNNYLFQISKQEGISKLSYYYRLCKKSADYFPLKEIHLNQREQLPFLGEKTALIQIKNNIINATAKPTDPNTLLSSLRLLRKLHYQLIFVGREKMPEIFNEFYIFNYAESKWANYLNDILIFSQASLAITSGSGIAFLPDRLNIPYLYLNSWQLQMSMPSKKAIMVPARLLRKQTKQKVSFSEQIRLYASMKDNGEELFPKNLYDVENASEQEILMALKELLKMPIASSKLQEKYKLLALNTPLEYGLSKCSEFFLKQHCDLI